jgi:hypothetical protein
MERPERAAPLVMARSLRLFCHERSSCGGCGVFEAAARADPRYLTTIGRIRSEFIEPVVNSSGEVIGTIDVEADHVNAFTPKDEVRLAACAKALQWLWV